MSDNNLNACDVTRDTEESLRTPGLRGVVNSVLSLSALPGLQMMQSFKLFRHQRLEDNHSTSAAVNQDANSVRPHTIRWLFFRRRSISSPKLLSPTRSRMLLDAGEEDALTRSVSSQDVTLAQREAQMDEEAQGHVRLLSCFLLYICKPWPTNSHAGI